MQNCCVFAHPVVHVGQAGTASDVIGQAKDLRSLLSQANVEVKRGHLMECS